MGLLDQRVEMVVSITVILKEVEMVVGSGMEEVSEKAGKGRKGFVQAIQEN